MNIYSAGRLGGNFIEREKSLKLHHRLFTYFYDKDSKMKQKHKVNLFLDSGAFSAWSQGAEININEYIDFIKKNKKYIDVYANLDAIGDPGKTLANQRTMEKAGLRPLPCFHYGEPIKYLKTYLKEYDYIALGGMVPISTKDLKPWLDDLFLNHLCDKKGNPKVKIHGFGMTALSLMLRYPWWSVDSTSWVVTGRMGGILIPRKTNGEYDFTKNPLKVTVSAKSPANKKKEAHFSTSSPAQQRIFRQYFEAKGFKLGRSTFRKEDPKTYELRETEKWNKKKESIVETIVKPGLCNDYRLRDELNIVYFLDLEKQLPTWPWKFKLKGRMKGFFEK